MPRFLKIGVGGVHSKESFNSKLENGASLVQIYTSFIYHGPEIVKKLLNKIFMELLISIFVILFLVGAISFLSLQKK